MELRGRGFSARSPSPGPPPKRLFRGGDSGGEAASLREAPLPQTPSPEERLAFGGVITSELVPPESEVRGSAAGLWSRRLTEPPRPCGAGARLRTRVGSILSRPSADGCFCGRSLGEFRLCGGDQRAFRSPFGNLRPPLMSLYRFRRWQVAAALSADVTTAELQGIAPTSQAEPSKRHRLTPNASRSSGGGLGEALLSEKRPPPASPQRVSKMREREGGDFSTEKSSPSQSHTTY